MSSYPSTTISKANLDDSTDSPASARTQLAQMVDTINAMIASFATANGLCDLDSGGKIPAARLPAGGGSGTDADLLDGQHGSYYQNAGNLNAGTLPAARFDNTAHGVRANGSLHAVGTTSTPGFMSAADKQAINTVPGLVAAAGATISLSSSGGTSLVSDGVGPALAIKGIAISNDTSTGPFGLSITATAGVVNINFNAGTFGGD